MDLGHRTFCPAVSAVLLVLLGNPESMYGEVAWAALGFGVLSWVQSQPSLLLSIPGQAPSLSLSPPLYDGNNRAFFCYKD